MDRFGVVPENKTVFPRTEAEYAAAAENAERQQQQQQEKAAAMGSALKEDDAVDETVAESEGPPRIFLIAKVVKKFKSKDGNAPQLAKNDIVEIEEMIAESKLWRVRFQEKSFLVPKATLKLLGPEEAMKLAPKRKAPEPQRKPATATSTASTTTSSSSAAAAVSMTVTTSTAAAGASAPVKPQATASFVAAPPKADDEKAETTATSPAPATPTASAATAKEGLQELLAQREREYTEAERAMDAKIAELEAAAAKREAALRMLEEKLAQARRLEEVYGRLTEQTRALRNAHERNLAYKREAEGLAVRVRITAEAKNEKPPSELTAEDLAF